MENEQEVKMAEVKQPEVQTPESEEDTWDFGLNAAFKEMESNMPDFNFDIGI